MTTAKQIISAMQYSFAATEETLTFGPFNVEIVRDDCPSNPYDNGDYTPPSIWLSLGNGFSEYGDSDLESFFSRFTPAWVSRNWRAICAAMDIPEEEADAEARLTVRDYGGSLSTARQELFAEHLRETRAASWGYGVDYLERLAALYRLADIPAETFQRNGYSQGDSVYGLIVMTPAWQKHVGLELTAKRDAERAKADMAGTADEYAAWIWGDVYGYVITGPDFEDSCYGFYGANPDKSGLAEAIAESLTHAEGQHKARRWAQIKTWIRNRAPLAIRAAGLESFA